MQAAGLRWQMILLRASRPVLGLCFHWGEQMPTTIKIVLFEDEDATRAEVLAALQKHLDRQGEAKPFEGALFEETEADRTRMYEERLRRILSSGAYQGVTLIVADRDLSKSQSTQFGGLSVSSVAAAAKELSVPICSYARQPETEEYEWQGRWEEGHIVLRFSQGTDELARRAVLAATGFAEITDALPEVLKDKANNSSAKILAALLGQPQFADKMALYGVGDQNRLTEILAYARSKSRNFKPMAHFLGYWLWDSLLRYPGLFVNEVAAASHLNMSGQDFAKQEIRDLFKDALYRGPFADPKHPQWWRGLLDDIVAGEGCADGLEFAKKRVDPTANRSRCRVDPEKPAGYYCIITREPVSLENSKGGMSWFPRGADLTRISNDKLEEYGPWLGI
jgi:hypothetical protein